MSGNEVCPRCKNDVLKLKKTKNFSTRLCCKKCLLCKEVYDINGGDPSSEYFFYFKNMALMWELYQDKIYFKIYFGTGTYKKMEAIPIDTPNDRLEKMFTLL